MAVDPDKRRQRSERLAELLARTALSNQQAFAELYRETSSHLYAVALRILRESGAAAGEFRQHLASRGIVRRCKEPTADVDDQHRAQPLSRSNAPTGGRYGDH